MCLKQVLPPSKRKRQHSEIKVHRLINSFISFPASKAGRVKSILAVWKRTGSCVFAVLPWNYRLHWKIFSSTASSHKMSLDLSTNSPWMREAHHLLLALPFSQEVGAQFWKSALGHVTKGTQVVFFLFQEAANTRLNLLVLKGAAPLAFMINLSEFCLNLAHKSGNLCLADCCFVVATLLGNTS